MRRAVRRMSARRAWRCHVRVVVSHGETVIPRQPGGDRLHRGVSALPNVVELELAHEVTRIEAGQARHKLAVAFSVKAVAGDARIGRTGIAARQRDQFAALLEGAGDGRGVGTARGERHRDSSEHGVFHSPHRGQEPAPGMNGSPF
nr:hypothetical protein [Pelagerythrobacter rhizovicinus]